MEIEYYKIPNFEYEISICGKVRKIGSNKILKLDKNKEGYPRIRITINKKTHRLLIHRLIAKILIPNPLNKKIVNHKDLDKSNFYYKNLEWVSQSENITHYYSNKWQENQRKKKLII